MAQKILLLEDDVTLNETVTEYLEENGYEVRSVYDGEEAMNLMYEKSFDLFILDVNVPVLDGFTILKERRENEDKTPAIYITSLNSVESLEQGYQSGADDYIRKPFALKELLLRVESILKRGYFHNKNEMVKIDDNIEFDINSSCLYKDEQEVSLNRKELKLLKLFLQNRNLPLTHEKIHETLWDYDESVSEDSLRTYVKNLRKHIGKERIVSIKKLGYKFT
jgi:DNA-binding response OmpR family regulator